MTLKVIRQILEYIESNDSSIVDPTKLYVDLHKTQPSLYNIELMNTIEYLNSFCRDDLSVQQWKLLVINI